MMKISIRDLEDRDACSPYKRTFRELFPGNRKPYRGGVEPTMERCMQYANRFDWGWAATRLLTQPELTAWTKKVDERLSEHTKQQRAIDAQFRADIHAINEQERPATEARDRVLNEAARIREAAIVAAWAEYDRVADVAYREHRDATINSAGAREAARRRRNDAYTTCDGYQERAVTFAEIWAQREDSDLSACEYVKQKEREYAADREIRYQANSQWM